MFLSRDLAELRALFCAPTQVGREIDLEPAFSALLESAREKFSVAGRPEDGRWFEEVAGLLMDRTGKSNASSRIECLLLCAQFFLKDGKFSLGIAVAENAIALSNEVEDFSRLRRCYSVLGNLHNATKDYAQATVCYARAVEIARSIRDAVGECASIANLAAARLHSGLLEESRTLNALVIQMACELEAVDKRLAPVRQQAHHNIALASLLLGDMHLGRKHIEYAIQRGPEPLTKFDAYQRVVMEYTYVRILSRAEEQEQARDRAAVARHFAARAESKPAQMQASLAETACDLNEGQFDIGLTRLHRLYDEARVSETMRRDVLEALVLGYDKAGRPVDSRRYHREYLNALSALQRRSAKAQLEEVKRALKVPTKEISLIDMQPEQQRQPLDEQVWNSFRKRLEAMAVLAELRDDATGEHAFRVGRLSGIFARYLGFSSRDVEAIELAARLHDIGKLVVPDVVLQKRGKLTDVEVEVMRRHTTEGAAILSDIRNESFAWAAEIALSHHEWWNGTGYPNNLLGKRIPEIARITSLADVFDALIHERPYKPAWPLNKCLDAIRAASGTQFEPRLVQEFLRLLEELMSVHGDNLDEYLGSDADRSELVSANRLIDRVIHETKAAMLAYH